jgi:hypothetical protein
LAPGAVDEFGSLSIALLAAMSSIAAVKRLPRKEKRHRLRDASKIPAWEE